MDTLNNNELIKKMRDYSGISQEALSNGICSVQTLSRIENNKVSVKGMVFSDLMGKMCSIGKENFYRSNDFSEETDYNRNNTKSCKVNRVIEYLENVKAKRSSDEEEMYFAFLFDVFLEFWDGKEITCRKAVDILIEWLRKQPCSVDCYNKNEQASLRMIDVIGFHFMACMYVVGNDITAGRDIINYTYESISNKTIELEKLGYLLAVNRYIYAESFYREGKFDSALREYKTVLDIAKEGAVFELLSRVYHRMALCRLEKGDYTSAEEYIKIAVGLSIAFNQNSLREIYTEEAERIRILRGE